MKQLSNWLLLLLFTGFIYSQDNDVKTSKSGKNETIIKRWSNFVGFGTTGIIDFLISYRLKQPITIGAKEFHPYFTIGKRYADFGMLYNSIDRSSGIFGLYELHTPIKLGKSTTIFGGIGWGQFVYRKEIKESHEYGYFYTTHFISETAYIVSGGLQFNINNWALIQPRLYYSPQLEDPMILTINAGFTTKSMIRGTLCLPLAWLGFHAFFILIGAN